MLVAAVALIFSSLNYFTTIDKKKKESLFLKLSKEGSANNLVFCSQEILQNKVIGIDGIHRKIMILEKARNKFTCSVISLDEVQNCELITSFRSLNAYRHGDRRTGESPNIISLRFDFKNTGDSASIIFYDASVISRRELELLKAKAEYWNVMFSKMLSRRVRIRA
jgi:hypothetical protein